MMEQKHLVVYLEHHGCQEVKKSITGNGDVYYIMKNPKNGRLHGVPTPSKGKSLKETTVCQVCKHLEVPLPPNSSPHMEDLLEQIRVDAERRFKD